jgi:UDP-N-acetylmuramate: L-alanyl-gamma-D-glutamyl-meso-diaminopimelate ligase
MHLHVLGICGTFMGGLAVLAKQAGHRVTGSDANVYPPMSTQLEQQGIELRQGYAAEHLQPHPDCVVVGNVMSRGNPAVEYLLDQGLSYTSGPQWLAEHVLRDRWVLAVAGTHGKTTTASLLTHILSVAGFEPGYLIGGVPEATGRSASLGTGTCFVVEADEYDTAFFDKRSKFVHYRPRTLILNNLEFDHADIFEDIAAIRRQFHHLVRTVPGGGRILVRAGDTELDRVLEMGCWTPVERFSVEFAEVDWVAELQGADGARFRVLHRGKAVGEVVWAMLGRHNVSNALAALAAAAHAGVAVEVALEALASFPGVKRRLQLRACLQGVSVYDDFAHHPTEVSATLDALRAHVGRERIVAVLEPRSNTMRMGVHREALAPALKTADRVMLYRSEGLAWDLDRVATELGETARVADTLDGLLAELKASIRPGDHVVIMSNGGFEGLHDKLVKLLEEPLQLGP